MPHVEEMVEAWAHDELLFGDNLHRLQSFPTPKPRKVSDEIIAWVDASWNVQSVSGGILSYCGLTLKSFSSRKQDVPALSSAEAELAAIVEATKGVFCRRFRKESPSMLMGRRSRSSIGFACRCRWIRRLRSRSRPCSGVSSMLSFGMLLFSTWSSPSGCRFSLCQAWRIPPTRLRSQRRRFRCLSISFRKQVQFAPPAQVQQSSQGLRAALAAFWVFSVSK